MSLLLALAASGTTPPFTFTNLFELGDFATGSPTPAGMETYTGMTTSTDTPAAGRSIQFTDTTGTIERFKLRGRRQAGGTVPVTEGHLYYMAVWVKNPGIARLSVGFLVGTSEQGHAIAPPTGGDWAFCSGYTRAITSGDVEPQAVIDVAWSPTFTAGDTFRVAQMMVLDITATYGVGSEPPRKDIDALISRLGWFAGQAPPAAVAAALSDTESARQAATAARTERHGDGLIRVASYNSKKQNAYGQATDILHLVDPDLLAVQEARTHTSDPLLGFDVVFGGDGRRYSAFRVRQPEIAAGWDEGRGTMSATPLDQWTWYTPPTQGTMRTVTSIGDRRVAFHNTHLSGTTAENARTLMAALYAHVSTDPEPLVILAGDFNYPRLADWPETQGFDLFLDNGWTMAQGHDGVWHDTRQVGEPLNGYIDNIIVSPGIDILEVGIQETYRSADHRMIWADLRLPHG